jgi:hypothetical protein
MPERTDLELRGIRTSETLKSFANRLEDKLQISPNADPEIITQPALTPDVASLCEALWASVRAKAEAAFEGRDWHDTGLFLVDALGRMIGIFRIRLASFRTSSGTTGLVNESDFIQASDAGSSFRVDTANCQYVYNLGTKDLGLGKYLVQISIDGVVGSGTFGLR